MGRALFLSLGIFAFVLGLQALLIDSATLSSNGPGRYRELAPPDWAPWSLMSAGAVVVLYSFTLPQKLKGGA